MFINSFVFGLGVSAGLACAWLTIRAATWFLCRVYEVPFPSSTLQLMIDRNELDRGKLEQLERIANVLVERQLMSDIASRSESLI